MQNVLDLQFSHFVDPPPLPMINEQSILIKASVYGTKSLMQNVKKTRVLQEMCR